MIIYNSDMFIRLRHFVFIIVLQEYGLDINITLFIIYIQAISLLRKEGKQESYHDKEVFFPTIS